MQFGSRPRSSRLPGRPVRRTALTFAGATFLAVGVLWVLQTLRQPAVPLCEEGVCISVDIGVLRQAQPPLLGLYFGRDVDLLYVEMLQDHSFEAAAQHATAMKDGAHAPENAGAAAQSAPTPWVRASPLQHLSQQDLGSPPAQATFQPAWLPSSDVEVTYETSSAGHAGAGQPSGGHAACFTAHTSSDVTLQASSRFLQGLHVEAGAAYRLRLRIKGNTHFVQVMLASPDGMDTLVELEMERAWGYGADVWEDLTVPLTPSHTSSSAILALRWGGRSTICLDWVSLTPEASWGPGGDLYPFHRPLVAALKQLQPQFAQVPITPANMPLCRDPVGNGSAEADGSAAGNSSFQTLAQPQLSLTAAGLGLYEYMWLAEELGVTPVLAMSMPALPASLGDPLQIQRFVQDVLDLMEYLIGPGSSGCGRARTAQGRPLPWNATHVSLGWQDCGRPGYLQAYRAAAAAVRAAWPALTLLSDCDLGVTVDFDAWQLHLPLDPHITEPWQAALEAFKGQPVVLSTVTPPVLAGSVAEGAVVAAVLTAAEQHCNKVRMVSLGTLLSREGISPIEAAPGLLLFNASLAWVPSPAHQIQRLFRLSQGSHCAQVRLSEQGGPVAGVHASATCASASCPIVHLKLVNANAASAVVTVALQRSSGSAWPLLLQQPVVLQASKQSASQLSSQGQATDRCTSVQQPALLQPHTVTLGDIRPQLDDAPGGMRISLPPWSLTMLDVQLGQADGSDIPLAS